VGARGTKDIKKREKEGSKMKKLIIGLMVVGFMFGAVEKVYTATENVTMEHPDYGQFVINADTVVDMSKNLLEQVKLKEYWRNQYAVLFEQKLLEEDSGK